MRSLRIETLYQKEAPLAHMSLANLDPMSWHRGLGKLWSFSTTPLELSSRFWMQALKKSDLFKILAQNFPYRCLLAAEAS